jgi:hypothetical protein
MGDQGAERAVESLYAHHGRLFVLDFVLVGSPGAAGHLAEGPVLSYTLAQAHHRARMERLRIYTHNKQLLFKHTSFPL